MKGAITKLILIVEDDKATADNLYEFLTLEGFRTLVVNSGESAYQSAKIFNPSLVTCDLQLPGENGIQIYLRFKSNAKLKVIPFLIITAAVDKQNIDTLKSYGLPYLSKPFKLKDLMREIEQLIF